MTISSGCGAIDQKLGASAIALTFADWQELVEQAQQRGEVAYQQTAFGTQMKLPNVLGEGCDRIFKLHDGLEIRICEGKLRQSFRQVVQHESSFPLAAKFYLYRCTR